MRIRRTKEELEQLDNQLLTILAEDHPQSVRHMFYRMTDPTLPVYVPKTDTGTNNGYKVIQRRLSYLRKKGRLKYSWITDMSRRGYFVNSFKNAADFIKSMANTYRGDLWRDADCHVEVWCESRSIAGVILEVCEEYCVDLYPASGFSSLTLTYDSAVSIYRQTNAGEKPAHILYIGDYVLENLQTLCRTCNSLKGNMSNDEFLLSYFKPPDFMKEVNGVWEYIPRR